MQLIINAQHQEQFDQTTVEIRTWMSNYIPLFYMFVITYPCPNPDAGLGNFCWTIKLIKIEIEVNMLISIHISRK